MLDPFRGRFGDLNIVLEYVTVAVHQVVALYGLTLSEGDPKKCWLQELGSQNLRSRTAALARSILNRSFPKNGKQYPPYHKNVATTGSNSGLPLVRKS